MLRSEIEKLRDELREKAKQAAVGNGMAIQPNSSPGSKWAYDDAAYRLTAIIDADPVAKLEAMGWRLFVDDRYGRICYRQFNVADGEAVGIKSGLCLSAIDLHDAAARQ